MVFGGVCVAHLFSFLLFSAFFVFVLFLMPNAANVSELSILDHPFAFLLTFIIYAYYDIYFVK